MRERERMRRTHYKKVRIGKWLFCKHRLMVFATIGVGLFIVGEWLHHEIYGHGAEFFILPVIEHLLDKVSIES